MVSRLIGLNLWFSSYQCIKFVELLQSQKSRLSIFPGLKELTKVKKKTKNYSKTSKLVRQSLLSNSNKSRTFFWSFTEILTLSLPVARCAGHNTNLPSKSNISKTVRVNTAFTNLKEHSITFLMVSRFIDFALVIL